MRRRLFNAVCVVSLVVAAAMAGLWVRSVWWRVDFYVMDLGRENGLVIVSTAGSVRFYRFLYTTPRTTGWRSSSASQKTDWWFTIERFRAPSTQIGVCFIPYWFLLLLFLSFSGSMLLTRRWMNRTNPTSCPRCGYDLRGTVSPACPECGEARDGRAAGDQA